MIDEHDLLARAAEHFAQEPGIVDRVYRRQRRKQRNQRIAAAVVALVIAVAAIGAAVETFRSAMGRRPASETGNEAMTPSEASRLRVSWTSTSRPSWISDPVVAGDQAFAVEAFAAGWRGKPMLAAFPLACSGTGCPPEWEVRLPVPASTPIYDLALSEPLVGDAEVYASGGLGMVAVPQTCGGEEGACSVGWSAMPQPPKGRYPYYAPSLEPRALADRVVYAIDYLGRLYAYPVGCRSDGGVCGPLWTADAATYMPSVAGGPGEAASRLDLGQPPVSAANDGVVVTLRGRTLSAFEPSCRTDGGECRPIWTATIGDGGPVTYAVLGDRVLAYDSWAGSGASNGATLSMFDARCRTDGGVCQPSWSYELGINSTRDWPSAWFPGWIAEGDGTILLAGVSRMIAFDASCTSACRPVWMTQDLGPIEHPPAITGEFIYAPSGNRLFAYRTSGCGSDICSPVWSTMIDLEFTSAPVVAGDVIFLTASPADELRGPSRLLAFPTSCGRGCRPLADVAYPSWGSATAPVVASRLVLVSLGGPSNESENGAVLVGLVPTTVNTRESAGLIPFGLVAVLLATAGMVAIVRRQRPTRGVRGVQPLDNGP